MPFDPQVPPDAVPAPSAKPPPDADAETKQWRREDDWKTAHREWLPYWQQRDPVPPPPDAAPEIETPGEVLTERQEAFCRAYLEFPVARKAAVSGRSCGMAGRQSSSLS